MLLSWALESIHQSGTVGWMPTVKTIQAGRHSERHSGRHSGRQRGRQGGRQRGRTGSKVAGGRDKVPRVLEPCAYMPKQGYNVAIAPPRDWNPTVFCCWELVVVVCGYALHQPWPLGHKKLGSWLIHIIPMQIPIISYYIPKLSWLFTKHELRYIMIYHISTYLQSASISVMFRDIP